MSYSEEQRESVGGRLRRLRLERGLSQRELSGPGVSYAYISRIEAGERRPSVKALRVLARKLGVSAEYLETGNEIRADEERELRLADAELEIRLAEEPSEAASKIESLLEESVAAGDHQSATRARLALGLAAAQAERHADAVARLEEAIDGASLPPHARPDVYATLGRSLTAVNRMHDAIALFERCLSDVRNNVPGDVGAYVRFATYLSYALTDGGQVERAEAVMKDALARARNSADPYTRVRVYWSLARLMNVEGHASEALDYMRRAIALLEATDDTLHLARAHVLSARIEVTQGNAAAATEHLGLADALLGHNAEAVDRGQLRIEQSRCARLAGDPVAAVEFAREALNALGDHYPADRGEASLALAEALAASGSPADAEAAFNESIALLRNHGGIRELHRANDGLGHLLAGLGREAEAHDVFAHAAQLEEPQTH